MSILRKWIDFFRKIHREKNKCSIRIIAIILILNVSQFGSHLMAGKSTFFLVKKKLDK